MKRKVVVFFRRIRICFFSTKLGKFCKKRLEKHLQQDDAEDEQSEEYNNITSDSTDKHSDKDMQCDFDTPDSSELEQEQDVKLIDDEEGDNDDDEEEEKLIILDEQTGDEEIVHIKKSHLRFNPFANYRFLEIDNTDFVKACLYEESMLLKNEYFEIHSRSEIDGKSAHDSLIKVIITIKNLSARHSLKDFSFEVMHKDDVLHIVSTKHLPKCIRPGGSVTQKVYFKYISVPFENLRAKVELKYKKLTFIASVGLPTTMNKFLIFKKMHDNQKSKNFWNKFLIVRQSEIAICNPKILSSYNQLMVDYFPESVKVFRKKLPEQAEASNNEAGELTEQTKKETTNVFEEFIEIAGVCFIVSEEMNVYYRIRYSKKSKGIKFLFALYHPDEVYKELENDEANVLNFVMKSYIGLLTG